MSYYHGMTLRDYFAAQALTGIIVAHPAAPEWKQVQLAYDTADAMLKAREVKQPQ
jgi:hypothetical protein